MSANELTNVIEASAWIAAAGNPEGEGAFSDVVPEDFFFRSLSGFVNRIEVLAPLLGVDWATADAVSIALFLDRAYARDETSIQLQSIDSFRLVNNDPAVIEGLSFQGPIRVLPLSASGFRAVTAGPDPFVLPGSLDPFSVLLVIADLAAFQEDGAGLEFGIQLMRIPRKGGDTAVSFTVLP